MISNHLEAPKPPPPPPTHTHKHTVKRSKIGSDINETAYGRKVVYETFDFYSAGVNHFRFFIFRNGLKDPKTFKVKHREHLLTPIVNRHVSKPGLLISVRPYIMVIFFYHFSNVSNNKSHKL